MHWNVVISTMSLGISVLIKAMAIEREIEKDWGGVGGGKSAKVGLTEISTKNRGRSGFSSRSVHISRYFKSVGCTVLIIGVPTWVKSAPMKACSMPIHMVIGISSCWLGFLRCDTVAANNCRPVISPLSPLSCFSPYLNRNKIRAIYMCNRPVCSEHSILRCYDVSIWKYLLVNLSVQVVTTGLSAYDDA
jgi:hypothetical protein